MTSRAFAPVLVALAAATVVIQSLGLSLPVLAQTPPLAAGCQVLPVDDIWNTPVDHLPVDPSSDTWIATVGADTSLRADFGGELWEGAPIGIPWVDAPDDQPMVPVSFRYADESDPGPYPIPADAPIEGGPDGDGDRHVLVVAARHLHPVRAVQRLPPGRRQLAGRLGRGVRPRHESSCARTAGPPRMRPACPSCRVSFATTRWRPAQSIMRCASRSRRPSAPMCGPARHLASDLSGSEYPPMGQRFRLRADFDLGAFSPDVQVILRALQTYGMMLADNGSPWFVSGAPDERWDDEVLQELRQVHGSDLEAVDVSSLMVDPDSGQVGAAPAPQGGQQATTSPTDAGVPEPDLFVDASNTSGIEDGTARAPFSTRPGRDRRRRGRGRDRRRGGDYLENVRIEGQTLHLYGGYSGDFARSRPGRQRDRAPGKRR